MKSNISISVDDRFNKMIESLRKEADEKGQSFSRKILDTLEEALSEKQSLDLGIDSEMKKWIEFAKEKDIDLLKDVSGKCHAISLMLEAYIKYDSYNNGERDTDFKDVRQAAKYLRSY